MTQHPRLILASASPRRLALLEQAGIGVSRLLPTRVDETPLTREMPRRLAKRLAHAKANAALMALKGEHAQQDALILAADTVVAVGRRILPRADTIDSATQCLRLLSARAHRVYTGICLITADEVFRQRLVETRVRFKRLSQRDIEAYIASGEWQGKAGGYAIQGIAGTFVIRLIGSYTNVVGLPLQETVGLLHGGGYPVHEAWENAATDGSFTLLDEQ